jgi:outer membrane protein OmpA-like peptidoglycan-associated protein
MRCHLLAALVPVLLTSPLAAADGWIVAEAPAAVAVSDAQEGVFRPGIMPAFGVYADNDRIALGLRVRAGVLRNGPAPGAGLADPSYGGLTTGGFAVRLLLGRGWVEGVGGGGITGKDFVPVVEAGIGWAMAVGKLDIGPSLRYVRVISRDRMDVFGTAELALVGIDVRFGKDRPRARRVPPPVAVRHEVAAVEPPPAARDGDAEIAVETSCANTLDGCRISEHIVIHDDRIVLDERVLFDLARARVRSQGREVIAQIAALWKAHPEWKRITVEGYADVRGTDEFNLDLSRRRAAGVRDVMAIFGCDASLITAVGFGRTNVRDPGDSEAAHQRNRRVEFVIERGGQP